jgi:hypothetical protein
MKTPMKYPAAAALILTVALFTGHRMVYPSFAIPSGTGVSICSSEYAACTDRACLSILAPAVPREATFGDEPMPAMEPTPGNQPKEAIIPEPWPVWVGLEPVTPVDATFEEPADPGEAVLPHGLAPVTPAEADFTE